MDLKSKILRAINKGLNEALDLDDFSDNDLKISKKSLKQTILNSNFENKKYYYQDLMNLLMSKNITREDIEQCIDWYKEYGVLYNPLLDGEYFKSFIRNINHIYYTPEFGNNVNLNWIDTSEVTDMNRLFIGMKFYGDISEWNVSNVTNMDSLFYNCKFNGDISKWNTSNVTNMTTMFCHADFNKDISSWNISNVTTMKGMFAFSSFNQDISRWDVSNVTDMSHLFSHSNFNGDISLWNISNVKDTNEMFENSNFNQDISNWNLKAECNTKYMFYRSTIDKNKKPKKNGRRIKD